MLIVIDQPGLLRVIIGYIQRNATLFRAKVEPHLQTFIDDVDEFVRNLDRTDLIFLVERAVTGFRAGGPKAGALALLTALWLLYQRKGINPSSGR